MTALVIIWIAGMTLAAIALASCLSIMEEHWTAKLGLLPLTLAVAVTWPLVLLSAGIFWLERRFA